MGKALAALAALFGLTVLILGIVMTESITVAGVKQFYVGSDLVYAYYVFSGLWLMSVAGALYCLFAER